MSTSTYKFDLKNSGACNVGQDTVVQAIKDLAPGETMTIENTTVEHEYDVFYGSGSIAQGWSQHRTVRAVKHRQAAINWLSHNYGNGARILVVGPGRTSSWSQIDQKIGRVFEINHCDEGDPRIVHTYTNVNHDDWYDYCYGYGRRKKHNTVPTQYYRIDEVKVVPDTKYNWDVEG